MAMHVTNTPDMEIIYKLSAYDIIELTLVASGAEEWTREGMLTLKKLYM